MAIRTTPKPTVEDQKMAAASLKWAKNAADLEAKRKTLTGRPSTAEAIVRAQIPSVGAELDNIARRVGRPSSAKVVVSLRLDPDVIAAFRATGPGWQARINEILRKCAP